MRLDWTLQQDAPHLQPSFVMQSCSIVFICRLARDARLRACGEAHHKVRHPTRGWWVAAG